jgi:hypothetical protein
VPGFTIPGAPLNIKKGALQGALCFWLALRSEHLAAGLEDFVQRLQRYFGNDLAVVIKDFVEQFPGLRAHAEQDDDVLAAAAFAVRRFAGRRDSVAAGRADFAQAAVFFVDAVFALDDEGVVERLVAVQDDLLAGGKLEDDVGDALLQVDLQDGKDEVREIAEGLPGDVAVVEAVGGHHCLRWVWGGDSRTRMACAALGQLA